MQIGFLVTYLLTIFIVSITPGPGMLMVFNNGVKYGVKKSLITALGITIATSLQAIIAIAGLGVLLVQSEKIYFVIKSLGALYLIYIGVRILLSKSNDFIIESDTSKKTKKSFELLRDSFIIGFGNPKAIVFFTALFPQFLHGEIKSYTQYGIMITIISIMTFLCMSLYSFLGARSICLFRRKTVQNIFNKITGGIFISLGIGIALEK